MSSVGPHGSQILKTKKSRIRCLGTASWTASTRGRRGRFRTGLTVIPLYVIGLAQWVTNTTNRQSRTLCICARPPGWQVVAMRPIRRCIDHRAKLPVARVQSPQNCTTNPERCQVILGKYNGPRDLMPGSGKLYMPGHTRTRHHCPCCRTELACARRASKRCTRWVIDSNVVQISSHFSSVFPDASGCL